MRCVWVSLAVCAAALIPTTIYRAHAERKTAPDRLQALNSNNSGVGLEEFPLDSPCNLTFNPCNRASIRRGEAMQLRILAMAYAAIALGACAKPADQIAPAYVSPLQYEKYSCGQLAEEAQRISARAAQAAGVQDQRASSDAVMTTVGAIIFWPALFAVGGNDAQTYELARLKGEMEAIEQASIRKNCGFQFQRTPPPSPAVAPPPSG